MALAKLITKSNRKSLEILYYGKRWMLGSLIQLATQGIETQLHINPTIVSMLGLSGYEVDLELPFVHRAFQRGDTLTYRLQGIDRRERTGAGITYTRDTK